MLLKNIEPGESCSHLHILISLVHPNIWNQGPVPIYCSSVVYIMKRISPPNPQAQKQFVSASCDRIFHIFPASPICDNTFILNSWCCVCFPRWHRPTREDSTFWHGTTTWQIQNSHLSVHVIRFVPTAAATFQLHGTPVHQLGLFYLQRKNIGFSDNLESGRIEPGQIVFSLLSDCCYCISSTDITEIDLVYVRTSKLSFPWTDYICLTFKISHYVQLWTKNLTR